MGIHKQLQLQKEHDVTKERILETTMDTQAVADTDDDTNMDADTEQTPKFGMTTCVEYVKVTGYGTGGAMVVIYYY